MLINIYIFGGKCKCGGSCAGRRAGAGPNTRAGPGGGAAKGAWLAAIGTWLAGGEGTASSPGD